MPARRPKPAAPLPAGVVDLAAYRAAREAASRRSGRMDDDLPPGYFVPIIEEAARLWRAAREAAALNGGAS